MSSLQILNDESAPASTAGRLQDGGQVAEPAVVAGPSFAGNALLVTLGCAKNLVDSELMLGSLRERGFRTVTEPEQADLIVVNTCAFLTSAVEESIERILEMAQYKTTGRCRRLVVAGCMVERYREELTKTLPEVDQFVSTDELDAIIKETKTTSACLDDARRPYFLYDETMPRVRSTAGHSAYVKIAEGCDRPCSFCIIPKLRGGFRSRAVDSVVREVRTLVNDGVKELNLIGQDLTAYGTDFTENRGVKSALPNLLEAIDSLEDVQEKFWVRLLYAYPVGVNKQLIEQILSSPHVCSYLDLPLQHISHGVLKRMRRPLGERGTLSLVGAIRKLAPELALRTTFIVGFPGETEADVESLADFVSEAHFQHVGVFTYSQESEAESYNYPNQIPEEEKEARKRRILEAQQEVVLSRNNGLIGKQLEVLVEGAHSETDLLLSGRTAWQAPETDGEVIINEVREELEGQDLTGRFATVEVSEIAGYDLVGKVISVN